MPVGEKKIIYVAIRSMSGTDLGKVNGNGLGIPHPSKDCLKIAENIITANVRLTFVLG